MKIALLGPAKSVHISKISNELQKQGIDNIVISQPDHRDEQKRIKSKVLYLKHGGSKGYYLNAIQVKNLLKNEKCDILNAHYASGYGNLATWANFPRTVISVWGSDVYSFPYQSRLHRSILTNVLSHANLIFSTSNCMKKQTELFLKKEKEIIVTPFGINLEAFSFSKAGNNKNAFKIAFLKGTDPLYGYDVLLDALRILINRQTKQDMEISAEICGDSQYQNEFMAKVRELELQKHVNYVGTISHTEMPDFIEQCDVVCIPSRKESFGVVALEAMACGRPCVASNAEGLAEVIIDGETGYIFENENAEDCAAKLDKILQNPDSIAEMGYKARKHVEAEYDFSKNINEFIKGYRMLMDNKGK